jgi:hypothetical protein
MLGGGARKGGEARQTGAWTTILGPNYILRLSTEVGFALLMLLWTLEADRGGTARRWRSQRMNRIGARAAQGLVLRERRLRSIYSPARHWLNTL